MVNKEVLIKNYQLQIKSRTTGHKTYPPRFSVPDQMVKWNVPFPSYKPVTFTSPVVLDPATKWADPDNIEKVEKPFKSFEGTVGLDNDGYPMNPFGRTGINRRGVLGKWGANQAADGIITTFNNDLNTIQLLVIKRSDNGEFAFPGGMTDPGETPFATRNRELQEEISFDPIHFEKCIYESLVFQGFVDDPRNTDNAWMETSAIHTHLSFDLIKNIDLKAGDDAQDFHWVNFADVDLQKFYGSHGYILIKALEKFIKSNAISDVEKELLLKVI